MKKIGILGSRELSCKILNWIVNQNNVDINNDTINIDIDTGEIKWAFKPDFICKRDNRQPLFGKGSCSDGFSAPPTVANDVIFVGSLNGQFYAVNSETGTKLWKYDTFKRYPDTVNKKPAVGGSIEAQGPVVSDSWVYTSSGYSINGHMTGNIFLAFSIE